MHKIHRRPFGRYCRSRDMRHKRSGCQDLADPKTGTQEYNMPFAKVSLCDSPQFGGVLSPYEGFLIIRGLKTLKLRVEAQNTNALYLAQWLEKHPEVSLTPLLLKTMQSSFSDIHERSRRFTTRDSPLTRATTSPQGRCTVLEVCCPSNWRRENQRVERWLRV